MNKFELDERFALGPSILHLASCGPETAAGTILEALDTSDERKMPELLAKFPNLDAFQSALGKIVGEDPFDPSIQEAYWIGNMQLRKALDKNNYQKLLGIYRKHGAFTGFIDELATRIPKKVIFHHNFQVTWIGVADAGGLDRSLSAANNCMIRGGKITEIGGKKLRVEIDRLKKGIRGYVMKKNHEIAGYDPILVKNLKAGDLVAVHWGGTVMRISKEQMQQLEYWTNETVKML